MKTWLFICIVVMALFTGACTDTFLVYKGGLGVFMGSNSTNKYYVLCRTGELEKVLITSHLDKDMKDALYQYTCSASRSGEKIRQIYASMTPEQRKDIKSAFRKNGFSINIMAG